MRNGPFSVRSLQFAFLLRISFGFMLFLLYTYYYPARQDADTFKYFDDSKYMYDALWTNPGDYFQMLFGINCETEYFQSNYFDHMSNWVRSYDNGLFNDNRLVIRINALMRIFSFGSYHVHSIILSYLAFLGSFYLSRVFYDISRAKIITYFSVFMVPSLVFWSSGILKEAVLLFALGVFAYHFYQLLKRNYHIKHVVILMLMSCILIVMKLYVFAAFLPAILVWYIVNRYKAKLWVYLLSYTAFVLIALLLGQVDPRYDFVNLIVDKQKQFIGLAEFYDVNSGFHMEVLTYELWDVIKACPEALFNAFTKPWLSEVSSILFVPAVIENLFFLLLLICAIMYKRELSQKHWNFILFCFSFSIILYCVIGLTTPITGAIVRYKIPAAPFLFMAVLLIFDSARLPGFLTKNKCTKWINTFL